MPFYLQGLFTIPEETTDPEESNLSPYSQGIYQDAEGLIGYIFVPEEALGMVLADHYDVETDEWREETPMTVLRLYNCLQEAFNEDASLVLVVTDERRELGAY